jgi:hypothetical protein
MAKKKVASWYWTITAMLTPAVLLVTLLWMHYTSQVHTAQLEAQSIERSFKQNRDQGQIPLELARMYAHMESLSRVVGFDAGNPAAVRTGPDVAVPRADRSIGAEERNLQPDKRSVTLRYYLEMESQFYGEGISPEQADVYRYASARRWISSYADRIRAYINSKAAQHYAIETILVDQDPEALQRLVRAGEVVDGEFVPSAPAAAGAAAQGLTLEKIFRRQLDLLASLYGVNQHQYSLLYGEVSAESRLRDSLNRPISTGTRGQTQRGERFDSQARAFGDEVSNRTRGVTDSLQRVADGIVATAAETNARRRNDLENLVLAAAGRISALQAEFETERAMHQGDSARFDDMLRNLPRLKAPTRLEKSDAVGEITYSDFSRGVCHINLGSADGVKAGQRFEVWRTHGREQDSMIAVVEIIRTLSPHYSLVTVLSLLDRDEPVRKGDRLFSQLWHEGRFLTVALHGDFEPPAQAYSKERLSELLRQMGCRVVDRVQPGVDLVILGSNLIGDDWYRAARSDLRFSTVREDAIRLYVDPR